MIALPERSNPTLEFAARELRAYLKTLVGTRGKIVRGVREVERRIVLGTAASSEIISELSNEKILESCDIDVFEISSDDSKVVLAGSNNRSVLYAVYALLERLGCLWLTPWEERIPKRKSKLRIDVNETEKAGLKNRIWYQEGTKLSKEAVAWLSKMKFNTIQLPWYVYTDEYLVSKDALEEIQLRDLILDIGGHSWYFFLPPEKYFEKHPEYYPLVEGNRTICHPERHAMQICTSNVGAVETFAKNVIEFFKKNQYVQMVTLWANDGWGFCECKDCLAIEPHPDEVEPTSGQKVRSVTYNLFIRKVGEIVGKVFPTKKIEFGAYYNLLPVPKREEVIPNVRNTALFLDYHYVCPCHSLAAPCNKKAVDSEFRKWRKAYQGDIHCVMYYGDNYRIVDLPLGLSERISADIEYIKELGLNGINSGIYSAPLPYIWEIHGANFYIYGKLAWNSNLSADTILREYFGGYYGSAGQAMLQYYGQWEEITKAYKKHASRILMAHDILTEEDISKLIQRLTRARENARTKLEKSRVMRARRVLAVTELLMEAERKNAGTERDRRLREICREIDRLTNHTPGLAVKSIITRFSYDTGGHLEKGSSNL